MADFCSPIRSSQYSQFLRQQSSQVGEVKLNLNLKLTQGIPEKKYSSLLMNNCLSMFTMALK